MRQTIFLAMLLSLLVLLAGWTLTHSEARHQGQIYSVAQVVAGLLNHPQQWAGHTVVMRGTVLDSRQGLPYQPAPLARRKVIITSALPPQNPALTTVGDRLLYAQSGAHSATLVVLASPPVGALSILRQVPLLDRFVPPPQRGSTSGSGVYRIQLAAPAQSCLRLRPFLHRLQRSRQWRTYVLQSRRVRDCYDGLLTDYLP